MKLDMNLATPFHRSNAKMDTQLSASGDGHLVDACHVSAGESDDTFVPNPIPSGAMPERVRKQSVIAIWWLTRYKARKKEASHYHLSRRSLCPTNSIEPYFVC
jgi:hypothetical protein